MTKDLQILLLKTAERLFYAVLGWLIIIPLTYLIPKKKNLMLFKASNNNVKYLYFYACSRQKQDGAEVYYLTRNKKQQEIFEKQGFSTLTYPSLKCLVKMFQAEAFIMDNHISPLNYYIFYCAKKIQLWHGIPLKQIGPASIKGIKKMHQGWIKELGKKVAFYPQYDIFMSTSDFYTQDVFADTIKTKQFFDFGYPRNDLLFNPPALADYLLGTDESKNSLIRQAKVQNWKVILYAPTFRDTGGDPITDQAVDLARLNEFGVKNQFLFVFKFHPTTRTQGLIQNLSNCIEYEKGKDIYPIMALVDLMITDYSSIYLDYLLLKRPVLFFPYDYAKYRNQDRDIQVDYEWITPGPKCYNQQALEEQLLSFLVKREDEYAEKRQEILDIAFKYQDGHAAERIWEALRG